MQQIPYGRQSIDEDDIRAVNEVLNSDWLTTGPKVDEFERSICNYCGCQHAIAVNSGTSALDIAIQSLELPKGTEVVTTPFTFAATSNALLYNGLVPIYADISKDTRNIDPKDIRKKITNKTGAILFVDFAGQPCDITEIQKICCEYDLFIIEDACHALGAAYQGKKIGSLADMTIFSFHPVKLITTGEGGMVTTNDSNRADSLRLLRSHGIDKTAHHLSDTSAPWAYDMVTLGRNYRMTDIQAALGISQAKKIDAFVQKRTKLSQLYNELLQDIPHIELPVTLENVTHAWHLYTIFLKGIKRDTVFSYLKSHNIGVNLHYIPTYHFSYYKKHHSQDFSLFPVTEDVFNRILTLPLYSELKEVDVHLIVDTLKKAIQQIS
ncbi:MAG: UDP-4-amino-4,6-dideoxy-N-acetyl-beta-L-altrosamine transaminase [Methanoregula sp.]|nr:UDP-4-amino-4,6-dideoxy-N-acetyl-beta-L-altrosamine transaminase [Methanoregula sp.]